MSGTPERFFIWVGTSVTHTQCRHVDILHCIHYVYILGCIHYVYILRCIHYVYIHAYLCMYEHVFKHMYDACTHRHAPPTRIYI